MNVIYASKLDDDAVIPTRKHITDAGMDLYALEESWVFPFRYGIIRTGVTVEIPDGMVGIIKAKSSGNLIVGAGVVDSGYQGELLVKLFNPSDTAVMIEKGWAIAQMVIVPCVSGTVEELPKEEIHKETSSRGNTGGIATQLSFLEGILSDQEARKFMEDKNES